MSMHRPDPPPTISTLVSVPVGPLKVAVTERAAVIETTQLPLPTQSPLQPATVEPLAALALQADPQLMPDGVEVTVPLPVPALSTESVQEPVLVTPYPAAT